MKKDLPLDYDITVDNMLDITEPIGNFIVSNSSFYNRERQLVEKNTLRNGKDQIFSMNDSIFILEVENSFMEVSYFYSENLEDLI